MAWSVTTHNEATMCQRNYQTHVEEMQMEIAKLQVENVKLGNCTMENPAIDFDAMTSDSRTVLCNSHCTAVK